MAANLNAKAPEPRLGQLRLLVALDALLVEGSVSKAAARIGLGAPAMSRLLKQIRELYGDPILVRSARGMVPTPFAETLRLRLRAVAAETEQLLDPERGVGTSVAASSISGWNHPTIIDAPPLAMRPSLYLEGEPLPADLARKLASIGADATPRQRLAKHIATVGVGAGGARPLSLEEADEAFSLLLEGEADPIQLGALLVVLQYRGLTAVELAGLTRASRRHLAPSQNPTTFADLDWPAYVSPKSRSAPWFLQSARLVADAGYRVLLHGNSGGGAASGALELAAGAIGIPVTTSIAEAKKSLQAHRIGYMPLAAMSPQLHGLLGIYSLLEMRSPLSAVVHLLNPLNAAASLLAAFRPNYRDLHRDAAMLLDWPRLCVLGNSRDVAQATPFRATTMFTLDGGKSGELIIPSQPRPKPELPTGLTSFEYWRAVWFGKARDEAAERIVVDTAAAAFVTLNPMLAFGDARRQAAEFWRGRLAPTPALRRM
ncbi:glycosyl transferase family protein [Aminobacter sp. AP02]|uniref:glycosyl transferase family protein n=1 Tax=Aminobacter sp. AP02 TaxID=2135737 RepID=UPI000D6DC131|nr:glycosyl transferase family protein [Aminobacter sp. AP02]